MLGLCQISKNTTCIAAIPFFFIDLMKNLHPVLILKLRKPAFSQDAFDQQLMALLNDRTLSLQKELCTSV